MRPCWPAVHGRIEALRPPPDAFEQTGIDEGCDGLAVPLEQCAVGAGVGEVAHLAPALTQGDGLHPSQPFGRAAAGVGRHGQRTALAAAATPE
jgi:hypothetical protein